jgi:hypothetical protein
MLKSGDEYSDIVTAATAVTLGSWASNAFAMNVEAVP